MEFMSQYDYKIVYVKGEDNTIADVLSHTDFNANLRTSATVIMGKDDDVQACAQILSDPPMSTSLCSVVFTLSVSADMEPLSCIQENYVNDPWCKHLLNAEICPHGIRICNGLLYMGSRLIILRVSKVHELLFYLAHDVLGHFGFVKTYGSLQGSFYWPNMCHDLEQVYIPVCADCQHNKGNTQQPMGPLHLLPILDQQGDSVVMDFIGPLPEDEGFDCIVTFTNWLNSDLRVIPTCTDISAEDLAVIFFNEWYCENGLSLEIISNHDKLFVSTFWRSLLSPTNSWWNPQESSGFPGIPGMNQNLRI
jgi:hypothetical protein